MTANTPPRQLAAAAVVLVGLIVAALLGGFCVPANAQDTASTFIVDSVLDDGDAKLGDGICATASGACTLRAAIVEANRHLGPDIIGFNIPDGGVRTIKVTKELPALNDTSGPTTIDGYTQPHSSPNTDPLVSNAKIMVQIEGGGHDLYNGLTISSSGNVVRGLALYQFNRLIRVYGVAARKNHIVGNFIGTNAAATYIAPKHISYANGVHVAGGAADNVVGGSSAAQRNVLSGNANHGVGFYNDGTDHNVVVGNLIGLSPSGTARLTNKAHGVDINNGASDNIVGGTALGERNVISGNTGEGVEISHGRIDGEGFPSGNRIAGNFIGTDVTGNLGPAYSSNGNNGVHMEDGALDNIVHDNVIGNNRRGVQLGGSFTRGGHVYANQIGVSLDGASIPNREAGVRLVSGVRGARIGPDNVITNNPIGVLIDGSETDFHTITGNSIFNNSGLGIDLAPLNTVNANDSDDSDTGANEQLNFPVLKSANPEVVRGTACGNCTIEVFIADASADGYGEGKRFVGSAVAGTTGAFEVPVTGVNDREYVTATATDVQGNTSEFSLNSIVSDDIAPTITITTPPEGAAYDLNQTVNADYGCADGQGGSGVASCVGDVASGELIDTSTSGPKTFTVTAEDNAGNRTSMTHNYTVSEPSAADSMAPTTSATISPVPNASGWNNSDVTVTLSATDNDGGSGVKEITYSATGAQEIVSTTVPGGTTDIPITEEGTTPITYSATDNAGNVEDSKTIEVKIDKTKPAISGNDVTDTTWRNTTLSMDFTASDAGGSGLANVADASFTLSASAESTKDPDGNLVPTKTSKEVTDLAGNSATRSVSALIDMTAPNIGDLGATTVPDGLNGWYKSEVTNKFSASDGLSGLPADFVNPFEKSSGTNEGSAVTISSGQISDVAGNVARGIDSQPFKIDMTTPTITITTPPEGAAYDLNQTVNADYGCADGQGGSGVASCVGDVASGELIDTSTSGPKTFTVTAEDNAGNRTSMTHNYTVSESPATIVYAEDNFSRSVIDGWGTADTGGAYSYLGTRADFDVNGSMGTMLFTTTQSGRSAILKSVSERDVNGLFKVRTDKTATGGRTSGQRAYFIARHVSQGNEYRARLRFTTDEVLLEATKLVAGNQTSLSAPVAVPALTHTADKDFAVRTQVVGTNPTTIRIRVWEDGQTEPLDWQYSVTDAEPSLQTAGAVGLRAFLSKDSTVAPVLFSFEHFLVTSATAP